MDADAPNDIHQINERLDAVEYLIKETDTRNQLTQHIRQAGDIERLAAKVPLKRSIPSEVAQVARGLQQTEAIKQICALFPMNTWSGWAIPSTVVSIY